MDLTAIAIERNRVTIIVVTLAILSGLAAYMGLPKAQDPGFTIRVARIVTHLPGASPERMELLVTDKIEKKIQEMPELDNVTSESRTGISIITVNFLESYDHMRPIFDDLRRKIDDVAGSLPAGSTTPILARQSTSGGGGSSGSIGFEATAFVRRVTARRRGASPRKASASARI